MKTTVKDGQTLADIAIQEFGTLEALPDLARVNSLSMSDVPSPGTVLALPETTYNLTMQRYCKAHDVSPATARDESGVSWGVFTSQFSPQFT